MIDPQIINKIIETWKTDQGNPGTKRIIRPIPDVSKLQSLIDICFSASLKKEEQRNIRCALSHISKLEFEDNCYKIVRKN